MNVFRVQIRMEVEIRARDQAEAHAECEHVLRAMEDAAKSRQLSGRKPFTKVGLAIAHAMVQG